MTLTRTLNRLVPALLCGIALSSCSSLNSMMGGNSESDALKAMKWTYAGDGVQIAVTADPRLNQSNGQPHTLAMTVVQMEDPSVFAPYASSSSKMSALLLADAPPPGLLALNRLFITPSENQTVTLPRVEKAQYVGLVTGYYHLDPARSARLYQVGVEVDSSGIVIKTRNASPEPLKIDLRLGPDGIEESPGTRTPPVEPVRPKGGEVSPPIAKPAQPASGIAPPAPATAPSK
ncbi:type VI secretion system lipoprotein TssJ [Bordetella bronchialis]|uniref:Type VI secretion system-associated lipoprotein n=1 Tax=Bordetella bronchialis TaxID=463025 RepID=A0A193FMQ5_9BORD|nr:type VI secretion system lipoprotein TssJ [Bordetella bronchialis]ANN68538.1 type VI secretion system-associated lipoprotein [Bordetella bronchialis]ANN73679.1 type VI secretion system-associated lipoprotein [Bordetella bronchialis]